MNDDYGTQALWPQMIAALAAIDEALGLPADGCNSTSRTLDEIQRLRAALEKQSLSLWQPESTAPKDGTAVIVLLPNSDVPHSVRFVDGGWQMVWDSHRLSYYETPRYWMPAPNDPNA